MSPITAYSQSPQAETDLPIIPSFSPSALTGRNTPVGTAALIHRHPFYRAALGNSLVLAVGPKVVVRTLTSVAMG